jgi:succinyl-CoA synthetase alpha subunit
MSILVNKDTRLIVQGITGAEGLYHAKASRDYGTNVVGGISPGKGGREVEGFPVFDGVAGARTATGANATMIFVPPAGAADAILEALDAGMELVVCVTEGIPVEDMVKVRRVLPDYPASRLIGPNCPGVISPGLAKVGIMPGSIHRPGRVGVISRSGTLMYEAVSQLGELGIGESSCVGIGGDPLVGSDFVSIMRLFEEDEGTDAVLIIGEVGGTAELEAADFAASSMTKPVAAYIAGKAAPPGKRMGHAGAIASDASTSAAAKMKKLLEKGLVVAEDPAGIGQAVAWLLGGTAILETEGKSIVTRSCAR